MGSVSAARASSEVMNVCATDGKSIVLKSISSSSSFVQIDVKSDVADSPSTKRNFAGIFLSRRAFRSATGMS